MNTNKIRAIGGIRGLFFLFYHDFVKTIIERTDGQSQESPALPQANVNNLRKLQGSIASVCVLTIVVNLRKM